MASRTTALGTLHVVPSQEETDPPAEIAVLRARYLVEPEPHSRAQLVDELAALGSPPALACRCGARAFVDSFFDEAAFWTAHADCRRT